MNASPQQVETLPAPSPREAPDRRGFLGLLARGAVGGALLPLLPQTGTARAAAGPAWAPAAGDDVRGLHATALDPWERVRAAFDFRPGVVPMNAANLAPAPRTVTDAVAAAMRDIEADASFQNRAAYDALRERVRARLAAFLRAEPEEIALVRNATEANNIVVAGIPLQAGDEVVVHGENHPSNNVAWEVQAARRGIRLRRVDLRPEMGPEEQLATFRRAFTPRTRVVTFTDVSNTTGVRLPARELCAFARGQGVHAHVDGAQSFGMLDLDLHALGCDSYAASAHKWFMGPKESGVLYVRRERAPGLWPGVVSVGWGATGTPGPADSRRFESLGQRNDAVFAGLDAALDFHEDVGSEAIEARVLELAAQLKEGLGRVAGAELVTPAEAERSGGVVIARFPGRDAAALYRRLYEEHGISGAPTGGLRLCPHVYNSVAEVERAAEAVGRLAREG